MAERRAPRLRRAALAALTQLAILVVVVVGVPVVLVVVAGAPWPHPFAAHQLLTDRGEEDLLVVIAWLLWAAQVVLLARATVVELRFSKRASRTPRYIYRLAVRIAAAWMVVGGIVTGAALGSGAATPPTMTSVPAITAPRSAALPATPPSTPTISPTAPSSPPAAVAPAPAPAIPTTDTVVEGQSLWIIAEQLYGSGEDWQLLANANLGRTMNDGLTFTDPNLIYAGWQLIVPPAPAPVSAPTQDAAPPPPPPTQAPPLAPAAVPSTGTPSPPPVSVPTTAHHPVPTSHTATTQAPTKHDSPHTVAPHPAVAAHQADPHHLYLPELVLLGVGALGAAALLAAAVRNRRLGRLDRLPGQATVPRSETAEQVATNLAAFAKVPALDLVAHGLSHLTTALSGERREAPAVRLIRVGPDGLTLVLAVPTDWAPGAFASTADGHAWVLPAGVDSAALPGALDGDPWLAALVLLGENAQGTFLAPVEPGTVVPLAGPQAAPVMAAMQAVARGWGWHGDRLAVVTSAEDARREAELLGDPTETSERARVLYFGDPGALDPWTRSRVGVVTTEPDHPSDLPLVCEQGTTFVAPFGLSLVPSALDHATADALDELLVPPVTVPLDRADPTEPVRLDPVAGPDEVGHGTFPEPCPVEVRVLAPVPRIEGASGPPPESRESRAIELLAYLALHGRPIPPYEVRAEAMATRSGEGSSQTLRQVATALRQWVGADHLPHAERSGGYRSADVSTDLGRLQTAVKLAAGMSNPDELVALLRPALDLIEGPPASRVGVGWGWWGPQFEAQAADAASDAACALAPVLADRGDGRGARWAIDQARHLDPYSEVLYRVAIGCASSVGNAAWIEREWRACEAMIEDLYPGASPSQDTYDAYHSAMAQFSLR